MKCMIDTDVLIAYVLQDSEKHRTALKALEGVSQGMITTTVAEELAQVLEKLGMEKRLVGEKLKETLASFEVVAPRMRDFSSARRMIMKRPRATFDNFNDNLMLSIAKSRGLPILTFDRSLARECKRNEVALQPAK